MVKLEDNFMESAKSEIFLAKDTVYKYDFSNFIGLEKVQLIFGDDFCSDFTFNSVYSALYLYYNIKEMMSLGTCVTNISEGILKGASILPFLASNIREVKNKMCCFMLGTIPNTGFTTILDFENRYTILNKLDKTNYFYNGINDNFFNTDLNIFDITIDCNFKFFNYQYNLLLLNELCESLKYSCLSTDSSEKCKKVIDNILTTNKSILANQRLDTEKLHVTYYPEAIALGLISPQ